MKMIVVTFHLQGNENDKEVIMKESGRKYLTGSIMLSRHEDGSLPEEYIIKSVIGEGGSAVCYEATRILKDGIIETGKLKEFYPVDSVIGNKAWYYSLERLSNGQLVPNAGTIRKFDDMCKEYIDSHKLLSKVMVDNPANEILKSYIQYGEILYGYMEPKKSKEYADFIDNRRSTVYIWSPGVPGKGFDVYLEEIKMNPAHNPEHKLQNILIVIESLTDCIKALHTAGIMYMDIKPSNFLIQYDSDFKIRPSNISLFDINTISSVGEKYLRIFGTDGFCAPEVLYGKFDNRTDIYSIGAMLFNSIVISKDIPDGLYRDHYYSNISQLVKNSLLFLSSETNSDATLMSRLCKILEKCLANNPRERYQGCSELKRDLQKVITRLKKMLLTPVEKSTVGLSEPTTVIQKLLYEHPLYEATDKAAKEINVLVIGSGTYGQKFIDGCLQVGQMSGIDLNIVAVSDEPEEDKEAYLRFRPAISEFVNVNGSLQDTEKVAYANVDFKGLEEIHKNGNERLSFTRKMSQLNREIIQSLLLHSITLGKKYNYVFVALGSDRLSSNIAKRFAEEMGFTCPVCYIRWKKVKPQKREIEKKIYSVCVNEPLDVAAFNQKLGEMAFNTHISWKDSLNIDVTSERNKFFESDAVEDRYNRTASLAFAVSIKYKLHSVQIDCKDLFEAAKEFYKQILEARFSETEAREKYNKLVDLEHRRWLIERAVNGWTAPRDKNGYLCLEDCVIRGSVKDPVNKTHPCMVRGSEKSPLSDSKYKADNFKLWDDGNIDSNLDELDRMSIELHRCFKAHAEKVKKENLFQNSDMLFIHNLIPADCADTHYAFKQLRFALKNIVNGVGSYSKQYDYYHNNFNESLKSLPKETKAQIEERLAVIKYTFFPVIESNLYRNYKSYDEVLIEKIPFILSYRYMHAIAMAFEDGRCRNGRNEAVFGNVAAATVLSPECIRFLYYFNESSDVNLLIDKFDATLNYFGKRNVHTGIEMIIACLKKVPNKKREMLYQGLISLSKKYSKNSGNAWLNNVEIFDVDNCNEAIQGFTDFLQECPVDLFDGGNSLFAYAHDNAMFIRRIAEKNIPYFEFDWRNKVFTNRTGCDYLRFVKDASFIRISDMFALMNVIDNKFNLPEFADDYENLWKIYTGEYLKSETKFEHGIDNWNHLCDCLEHYEKVQKPLAKILVSTSVSPEFKKIIYFLPEYTYVTVKSIVQKLCEYGIAEKESNIMTYTSDTCKLELTINGEYEQALRRVFMNPEILLPYYGIEVIKYKKHKKDYIEIRYDNLMVTNVNLDSDNKGYSVHSLDLLKALQKANFIRQLEQNKDNSQMVSFVYSSPRIKKLLTSAGEILGVYSYYDVLKTGFFDDVASGCEFYLKSGGAKNEINLVLTKGFKSIIVKCKAVVELKQDYYEKLHSTAEQFGIGTIKVLLGNTYKHSDVVTNELNAIQRSSGSQLYIKTISSREKIINIGQVLKKIMEEN